MSETPQDRERAWQALGLGPMWMLRAQGQSRSESPREPSGPSITPTAIPDAVASNWEQLKEQVSGCTRCSLCTARKNTVFGVGDTRPNWLIVGEAPGAQEDRLGEPFVGEAGQLLDAMLAAVGAKRGDGVFIANVLKCRPPGNRDPEPTEVASCRPYLMRQIELLQPKLIVTMGRFAAQALLETDSNIGALRTTVHQIEVAGRQIPVVAGYHPAYLLRRPEEKAKAWADLCLARSVCDATGA